MSKSIKWSSASHDSPVLACLRKAFGMQRQMRGSWAILMLTFKPWQCWQEAQSQFNQNDFPVLLAQFLQVGGILFTTQCSSGQAHGKQAWQSCCSNTKQHKLLISTSRYGPDLNELKSTVMLTSMHHFDVGLRWTPYRYLPYIAGCSLPYMSYD